MSKDAVSLLEFRPPNPQYRLMTNERLAVEAIIETIPMDVLTSGKVARITDGVLTAMRILAPAVIMAIVQRHGPAEPIRSLQLKRS